MEKVLGIDLGTTYSVMAIYDKHVKIIQNETDDLTRSVVGIREGKKIVGNRAYELLAKGKPENIIVSIKRIIGREFSDPKLQEWKKKKKPKYQIKVPNGATDKSIAVILGDKEYLPEEISAEILKKLKEEAEKRGYEINKAVITVPAYFNDKQKDATRKAAYLAGLKVSRILPEPTASAISYKIDALEPGESKTILVYDLGGGTFDVCLLQITGGTFIELGIGGDMWFGGDDLDDKLMQFVLKQTATKCGMQNEIELLNSLNLQDGSAADFLLKEACRKAKEELSSMPDAYVDKPVWCKDKNNNIIDVDIRIDRADFEALIEGEMEKTIDIIKRVVDEAKYDIDQIDNVLLVGGSSLIPLVRKKLAELFDDSIILLHTRPMLSVAEGAAILANRLAQVDRIECPHCGKEIIGELEECPHCQEEVNIISPPVSKLPMSYGIQTKDEPFSEIIPKEQYYPTGIYKKIYETEENQHVIIIPIKNFDYLDETETGLSAMWMLIPKDRAVSKGTRVRVSMQIDGDGISSFSAELLDGSGLIARKIRGGRDQEIVEYIEKVGPVIREKEANLSEDEKYQVQELFVKVLDALAEGNIDEAKKLEGRIKKIIGNQDEDRALQEKHTILISYSEYILGRYHALLDPELTFNIQKLVEKLKEAVEDKDWDNAEKIFADLDEFTDKTPETVNFIDWIARASWLVEEEPVLANELDNYAQMLIDLCKNYESEKFNSKVDEITPKVKEIYKRKGELSSKSVPIGLLKDKSNY